MGNVSNVIKVRIRDLESVNFDKVCRLTLEIVHVRKTPFDLIKVVNDGPHDVDMMDEENEAEYGRRKDLRSMTELYALRHGLGTSDASGVMLVESPIVGLVALCQSLAENHGKVSGLKGGGLYRPGKIPNYARNLSVVPARASEIVGMLVKAVAASLDQPNPIHALVRDADGAWDGIEAAVSSAERKVFEEARDVARALEQGKYAFGKTFPLAKASGATALQGVAIETRNPNLMKHLWGVMKSMEPAFSVGTAVVSHPEGKRLAVLCSMQYRLDIRPVAKALAKRFPDSAFDVNADRNSLVWDTRSGTPGPTAEQVVEAVSAHLAFRKDMAPAQAPRFGATLEDRFKKDQSPKRR
jgi:hypothetical protein